jgi:hypothetical protein
MWPGPWYKKARLRIAKSAPSERKPIQIRAEVLRGWKPSTPFDARWDFATMTDNPAIDPKDDTTQIEAGWRDEDLKRAIAVAEQAGLKSYRIDITPDGTISIIVGDPAQDRE